jgi:hypothetical protein
MIRTHHSLRLLDLAVAFRRIGIPDQFCEKVGDWTYTREQVGLSRADVTDALRALLKKPPLK